MNIHAREQEIIDQADADQADQLRESRNYGSPHSFWSTAIHFGLVTEQEYERARLHYRDLWYYVGD